MAKEVKKNIRIPDSMADFVTVLAKSLNISENDGYKMIIFEYMRKTKSDMFYIQRG